MITDYAERLARHGVDAASPAAIVTAEGEIAYAELDRRVRRCAAWLRAEGVRPGEVVGITIADETTHLVASLALLALGIPQACLPSHEPEPARRRLARAIGVTRVVATRPGDAMAGLAASFLPDDERDDARSYPVPEALVADRDATLLYIASSGTTGDPKVIPLSARQLAVRNGEAQHLPRERMLLLSSVEDIFGKSARLRCTWLGLTSVFRPRGSSEPAHALGAYCAKHRVTRVSLSVHQATGLLAPDAEPLPPGIDLFVTGSRVPIRLREAIRARGRERLHVSYGTREVGLCSTTYPADREPALESVGAVAGSATLELVDADGRPTGAGEIGEIRVKTDGMVHAYHGDPAASARQFRDGWFHTGDLGSFSPNGSLCLHGRLDDVMNLNGIKIYPAEIERVLESDPAVAAAAAFALRSEVHGDIPAAAVVWQGPAAPDTSALLARTRTLLGVRSPRRILLVDALPRTATGKVLKRELARLVEGGGSGPPGSAPLVE